VAPAGAAALSRLIALRLPPGVRLRAVLAMGDDVRDLTRRLAIRT
jgi:hypothetical protein